MQWIQLHDSAKSERLLPGTSWQVQQELIGWHGKTLNWLRSEVNICSAINGMRSKFVGNCCG